jgi:restriction system protein
MTKSKSSVRAPQFVRYFGPVIDALQKLGGSGRPEEVRARIVQALGLSDKEQTDPMSSGIPRFENQVHWARFYLSKGGYIDSSRRGVWSLTDKSRAIPSLTADQAREIFRDVSSMFAKKEPDQTGQDAAAVIESTTPEQVEAAGLDYAQEVSAKLMALPAAGFERFCQRLLRESGFQEVTVTGRSGDGGIDGIGILQVNALVSFKVLFQCKRYRGTVGPGQVRDFRGAMMGRADKGIILTTGSFTADARREAVRDGVPPIELVDGEKLVAMLEQLELGLKPRRTFEIDASFFKDFEE